MTPFDRITKERFEQESSRCCLFINGTTVHPNPKFYKYYWWVYPANSPYECAKDVFYKPEYRLTTKEMMDLCAELDAKGISYAYVNSQRYRLGNQHWDYEAIKKRQPEIEFALSYDEDTDIEYEGHK
jgi:hypothetical protein